MANEIKCTYDDCFRHFSTVEAMKKHKHKDRTHDYYCKKCDMDCTDDVQLMYHQITSQRHIACPVCGMEFKSEAGRDRHVEIQHIPKQSLTCVGCQKRFEHASALMGHIEDNECEVISAALFKRQLAEKQVVEDAWNAAMDPTAGSTVLANTQTAPSANNEKNLLDDERAFVSTDWRGQPQYDENNERNGPYVDPPTERMSNLSVSRFPPLGPQSPAQPKKYPLITDEEKDLVAWNEPLSVQPPGTRNVWVSNKDSASRLFKKPTAKNPDPTPDTLTSVNLLDTFTDDDFHFNSARSHTSTSTFSAPSSLHPQASTLPPSARAQSTDPNAPHSHIQTHHPLHIRPRISLDSYWDPVLNTYICPSQKCGEHHKTPQAFDAHLSGPNHVGGYVQCPSCFKKFKTTTALISHCESGSRRCRVRDAMDFDLVIQKITAGIMAVDGLTEEGSVRYTAQEYENW